MGVTHISMIITTTDRFLLSAMQKNLDYNYTRPIHGANGFYTMVLFPTGEKAGSEVAIAHAISVARLKSDIEKIKSKYPAIDIEYKINVY